jgi:hypothetical protein
MASNKNAGKFESIEYNNDLKLVRNIESDMFQCQSILRCLGYNEKKYKHIDKYFKLKGTKELIEVIQEMYKLERREIVVELDNNTENEYKGTYIHRFLINHFASWYSSHYCFKIQCNIINITTEPLVSTNKEHCYLIRLMNEVNKNVPIYKIGKSTKIEQRMKVNEYKNCEKISIVEVSDCTECEQEIIRSFKERFKNITNSM